MVLSGGLCQKDSQDDFDSEYIGFDGFPDDLHGIYAPIYLRNVRCHACKHTHTHAHTHTNSEKQGSILFEQNPQFGIYLCNGWKKLGVYLTNTIGYLASNFDILRHSNEDMFQMKGAENGFDLFQMLPQRLQISYLTTFGNLGENGS